MLNKIYNEDCLEGMKRIPTGCVDMILCDLPYGTTSCKWDTIMPFEMLWTQYERVIKPNGAIVLTAREPFTSLLVVSNIKLYRHKWVWNKKQSGSFMNAKFAPLQIDEDILVFGKGRVYYSPEMRQGKMRKRGGAKRVNGIVGSGLKEGFSNESDKYYPTNIIELANPRIGVVHPTQKPIPLFAYLIRTYTNPGETVLDNCMGSGTTAIACIQEGRNFIGFEKEPEYYQICLNRIAGAEAKRAQNLFKDAA